MLDRIAWEPSTIVAVLGPLMYRPIRQKEIDMVDNTTSSNAKDLPEMLQKELNLLNSKDIEKQQPRLDAAPAPSHREAVPGRRPLFRN